MPTPFALHYLAAFGPLLACLIMTAVLDGRRGLRGLLRRAAPWCTGGSLFAVGMWHALYDFASASSATTGVDTISNSGKVATGFDALV